MAPPMGMMMRKSLYWHLLRNLVLALRRQKPPHQKRLMLLKVPVRVRALQNLNFCSSFFFSNKIPINPKLK
uniref:Putative secreted protein n=1 Tax=Anopheles darlingi TaxID=43151 RepID=A0A2M4DN57_ANODA